MLSLIHERQHLPLSVPDLARAVNVSPSHLTRLFRQETGQSPLEFARALRLERAHEMLETTFMSVKEIMAAVGWNDPSHFCREFKRRFGTTPKAVSASRTKSAQF